jgi:hypothetical protein
MRWSRCIARIARRGIRIVFWLESQKERAHGRPGCRWEDNIKIYLRAVGWSATDWIELAQDMDYCRVLVTR